MTRWYEFTGNIHMHTVASDGRGTHTQLVQAAQAVGLDFLIVTDHNVLPRSEEGWRGSVLMLIGEEVHDPDQELDGDHLLCVGVQRDVTPWAADTQGLIDEVRSQQALSFLAHPFERNSSLITETYPWRQWHVTGYTGIELWNYMSEFRAYVRSRLIGLLIAKMPHWFTTGPWPETVAKWDALTQERPVVAIGGSDAHAFLYRLGPWPLTILPYEICFRAVNTHILAPEPFSGELAHDRALVLDALRQGHCWIGYDLPAATTGFRFRAYQGDRQAIMGDTLPAGRRTLFEVQLPRIGRIRLLRNGQVVSYGVGDELRFISARPGVYRVEVYRRAWGRERAWIFSNPIYVRD